MSFEIQLQPVVHQLQANSSKWHICPVLLIEIGQKPVLTVTVERAFKNCIRVRSYLTEPQTTGQASDLKTTATLNAPYVHQHTILSSGHSLGSTRIAGLWKRQRLASCGQCQPVPCCIALSCWLGHVGFHQHPTEGVHQWTVVCVSCLTCSVQPLRSLKRLVPTPSTIARLNENMVPNLLKTNPVKPMAWCIEDEAYDIFWQGACRGHLAINSPESFCKLQRIANPSYFPNVAHGCSLAKFHDHMITARNLKHCER